MINKGISLSASFSSLANSAPTSSTEDFISRPSPCPGYCTVYKLISPVKSPENVLYIPGVPAAYGRHISFAYGVETFFIQMRFSTLLFSISCSSSSAIVGLSNKSFNLMLVNPTSFNSFINLTDRIESPPISQKLSNTPTSGIPNTFSQIKVICFSLSFLGPTISLLTKFCF